MGTLLTFEPPAPHLRAALLARTGADVGLPAAERAIRAEIAYYRAHLHLGSDEAGLAALRRASARSDARRASGARDRGRGADLGAARVAAVRRVPRGGGGARGAAEARLRLVVVSNWDVSLHERLAETGLAPLVDGALASAELGVAKPDPAIFAEALALAGARAEGAWHVGDSVEADVEGALAAGIRPVLVARDGAAGGAPPGVQAIASLTELPRLVTLGAE